MNLKKVYFHFNQFINFFFSHLGFSPFSLCYFSFENDFFSFSLFSLHCNNTTIDL